MSYTALVRDAHGIPLRRFHVDRLARSGLARDVIEAALDRLEPGAWMGQVIDGALVFTPREGPGFLSDGLPMRVCASPYLDVTGRFPKPAPPHRYGPLRERGVVTLLCDAALSEVYETSVAMVLAWDGRTLVLPPEDRPRVDSTVERWIERSLTFERRPIRLDAGLALMAGNATTGVVGVGRPLVDLVPAEVAAALRAVHSG